MDVEMKGEKPMNLYLIRQEINNGYETYDSAVVVAESTEDAAQIDPSGNEAGGSWVRADAVIVEKIGVAIEGLEAGRIIFASFRAG